MSMKVKDLGGFQQFMGSEAIAAAMAEDGVKAETVKTLDKRLSL
jgi:hypothetical protein